MSLPIAYLESRPPRHLGACGPSPNRRGSGLLPDSAWLDLGSVLRLSPRELQIVRGVFEDRKEETIAFDLGISPHTVNTYFQRLYSKLGVSSRPQLILRVMAEYLAGVFSNSSLSLAHLTDELPTREFSEPAA